MNYFIAPPPVTKLPKFLYKYYPQQIFGSLMKWADNEYNRALDYAIKHNDYRMAKALYQEWSGMRILSEMDGFRYICAQLDEDSHRKLDRKTRKFIRKSYEMYELLRKHGTPAKNYARY